MKKCIFHYPGPLQDNPTVGSEVRPVKMLQAFREIGYDVEVISGYSNERRILIEKIKRNIRAGARYEFVYSESTTMPTALSDRDHLPRNPFLDERFFMFCRKNGIPVGLFYRDAYWQFPYYRERVSRWVPFVTIPFYKHELKRYEKCLDTMFVPSNEFAAAIGYKGEYKELPSGGDPDVDEAEAKSTDQVKLFYVGGVVGINNIELVVDTIKDMKSVSLTLCCPEEQWNICGTTKAIVEESNNIQVEHKKGEGVKELIKETDITLAFFERNPYRDLAMPVKLFEYICCGKPIIATSGTAAGRYIEDNNIGWTINYNSDSLRKHLLMMIEDRCDIIEKTENVIAIIPDNTWKARAQTVSDVLITKGQEKDE